MYMNIMPGQPFPVLSGEGTWLTEGLNSFLGHFNTILGGFTSGLGEYIQGVQETMGGFADLSNAFFSKQRMAIFEGMKNYAKEMTKSWDELDQKAFSFGKQLGMTQSQVTRLREGLLDLSQKSVNFGADFNKSLAEVMKLQSEYSASVGRQINLTNNQLKEISALSNVIGDQMAVKLTSGMEKFGLSVTNASDLMTRMYNESAKQGISLEAYSKAVTDNLHIAQQYAFKNGIEGLKSMAELSTKVRLDIQQITKLADKFSTLENAVTSSAELQVLGGPFAQFADPLALMHGSLSDMEELGERLADLVGHFGSWDASKGQFDLNDFDKLRLKHAASTMGLDYGNLIDSANRQAARKEVDRQLNGLLNIGEEYKELLRNTAQFNNGVAGIRDENGNFKSLSELSSADLEMLVSDSRSEAENIAQIATMMRGALDIQEGTEKERLNVLATEKREQAERMKKITDDLGHSKDALQQLVKLQLASAFMSHVIGPTLGLLTSVGRTIGGAGRFLGLFRANGGYIPHANGTVGGYTKGNPGTEYLVGHTADGAGISISGREFVTNALATEKHPELQEINKDITGQYRWVPVRKHSNGGSADGGESSGPGFMEMMAPMLGNPIVLMGLTSMMRNPRQALSMMGGMYGYGYGMGGSTNTAMSGAQNQIFQAQMQDFPKSTGVEIAKATNDPELIRRRVKIEEGLRRTERLNSQYGGHTSVNGTTTPLGKEIKSLNKEIRAYNRVARKYGISMEKAQSYHSGGFQAPKENFGAYRTQAEVNAMTPAQRDAYLKNINKPTTMSRVGGAAMGVLSGAMAAYGTYHSTKNQYEADGTAIMDSGKAKGGATGAAIGAGVATAALSFIPFVGPIVGPLVGPVLGSAIGKAIGESVSEIDVEESREEFKKQHEALSNRAAKAKYSRLTSQKYTKQELQDIAVFIADGRLEESELNESLVAKIKALGDDSIFSKTQVNSTSVPKYHDGTNSVEVSGNGSDEQVAILRAKEAVINPKAAQSSQSLINGMNNGQINDNIFIKVLEPMGKLLTVLGNAVEKINSQPSTPTKPIDINLNLSGSIDLGGIEISDEIKKTLINTKEFKEKIVEIVTYHLSYIEKSAWSPKKQRNQFPQ